MKRNNAEVTYKRPSLICLENIQKLIVEYVVRSQNYVILKRAIWGRL